MDAASPGQSLQTEWCLIKKEIVGIQVLHYSLRSLYWDLPKPFHDGQNDMPLLSRCVQTALVESVISRISRLMDKACTTGKTNLSLARIGEQLPAVRANAEDLRGVWIGSSLSNMRNKTMAHNDLESMSCSEHSLTVPLTTEEVQTLGALVEDLRQFRQLVNAALGLPPYLDQALRLQVHREADFLARMLADSALYLTKQRH